MLKIHHFSEQNQKKELLIWLSSAKKDYYLKYALIALGKYPWFFCEDKRCDGNGFRAWEQKKKHMKNAVN